MPSKGKRRVPEHNTPPDKGREKKTKADQNSKVVDSDTNLNPQSGAGDYYCDRCTEQVEQLIQCE